MFYSLRAVFELRFKRYCAHFSGAFVELVRRERIRGSNAALRIQHVLIDFENVQPSNLNGLDAEHFKVLLFIGANQSKLSFELAASMHKLGSRGEYVKITSTGSNALDFHIAFYVGQLVAQDPTGYFHFVSKDQGFDPLITHLRSKKIVAAQRWTSLQEIPLLKAARATTDDERLEIVADKLRHYGASRPRTMKRLHSLVHALFRKQLAEDKLQMLLKALQKKGWVVESENKLSYALPECAASPIA